MTWVLRTEPQPVHECAVPMAIKELTIEQADGEHGDLWRCDDCHTLWVLFVNSWQRPGWWLRIRHRRDGYPPKHGGRNHRPIMERGQKVTTVAVAPPMQTPPPPPPPSGGQAMRRAPADTSWITMTDR